MRPAQFDIASPLLAGSDGDWRWSNLGYWQTAHDYSTACADLARLHADIAELTAHSRVLEFACGYGASVDVWQEYRIGQLYAMEYRPGCVNWLEQQYAEEHLSILQGRFDQPLPKTWASLEVDYVLCVDAAYHAQSLASFLSTARSALKSQGVLCFSTLMLPQEISKLHWKTTFLQQLLKAAHIPKASLCSASQIQQTCRALGFTTIRIQAIEQQVFTGFADWVWQQQRRLRITQRYSLGWQKIVATARLCQWLHHQQKLNYVIVRAVKSD